MNALQGCFEEAIKIKLLREMFGVLRIKNQSSTVHYSLGRNESMDYSGIAALTSVPLSTHDFHSEAE